MEIGGSASAETEGTRSSKKTTGSTEGRKESQLELDDSAIEKIIADVLGSEQGLASIFGGEQQAGIFDSSVAAQASGDLVANLIGELAKITGKTVTTGVEDTTEQVNAKSRTNTFGSTAEGSFGL